LKNPANVPGVENYMIINQDIKDLHNELKNNRDLRNKIKYCPLCNSNIADRTVTVYKELIEALYAVYVDCGKNRRHEFAMKEIRHLLSRNNYARFGDLVRFGGLVYKFKTENGKKKKAKYGLNMKRCKEFFSGQRQIPLQIILNPITNEIIDSYYVNINNFPSLLSMLDKDGIYDYEKDLSQQTAFWP